MAYITPHRIPLAICANLFCERESIVHFEIGKEYSGIFCRLLASTIPQHLGLREIDSDVSHE